ncbi:hypothetical protein [Flavobacterium lindanitolerans]|uniref:hypothetical protein n=1 Tax=Flavobacterium lindanitolerans TaxID=428988 RepID=UPI0031B0B4E0
MKTLKTLGAMCLLATILFSCSSDDSGGGSNSGGFSLTAKVNGANYSNSNYFDPMAVITNNILVIQSSDNGGNSIQIQVMNYNGTGSYTSGNNNLMAGYINYLKAGATVGQFKTFTSVRGDGLVEITEVTDTYVKGTFSATAPENVSNSTESVEITEGTFKAKIQTAQ